MSSGLYPADHTCLEQHFNRDLAIAAWYWKGGNFLLAYLVEKPN